jgi:DNA helicase HerA-like ATPase
MLADKGVPGIVERTLIRPPSSKLGPISDAERRQVMAGSPMAGKYDTVLDRKSAYEILAARAEAAAKEADAEEKRAESEDLSPAIREFNSARRYAGKKVSRSTSRRSSGEGDSFGEAMTKVVIKELKGTTGRRIVRGILGGLFKGR